MANEYKIQRRIIPKWGFGMAPVSSRMRQRYDMAVQTTLDLLYGNTELNDVPHDDLSELKGMFNRCLRQDQWDWFSVFAEFGEPPYKHMRRIVDELQSLRRSLVSIDYQSAESTVQRLINSNLIQYLSNYQTHLNSQNGLDDAGWIYILSTREQPSVLKIGFTRRSVAQRVNEINSATGVLFPFSARHVFRVKHAQYVEQEIFRLLDQYRIRSDREFFEIPFDEARRLIGQYLYESQMRQRCRGEIAWFDLGKHYGFISTDENTDVFVHSSQIEKDDLLGLKPGTLVEFDMGRRPQGSCAFRVRVLQ